MIGFFKLVWFRTKVLRVLRYDFNYEPNLLSTQREAFNATSRATLANNGNEYDAAIGFMITQLSLLVEGLFPEIDVAPEQNDIDFVWKHLGRIETLSKRSTGLADGWREELVNSPKFEKYYA